jgi:hypothetical protein
VQKIINNVLEANLTNNDHPKRAATIAPLKAALSDQILIPKDRTWTARHRTDRAAIFRVSGSKISNAVALIGLVAGDLGVTVLAAEDSVVTAPSVAALAVAIASALEDSAAAAALADSAVAAGSGAGGDN